MIILFMAEGLGKYIYVYAFKNRTTYGVTFVKLGKMIKCEQNEIEYPEREKSDNAKKNK